MNIEIIVTVCCDKKLDNNSILTCVYAAEEAVREHIKSTDNDATIFVNARPKQID